MTATSDGSKKMKIESMLLFILVCQILPEKCVSRSHSSTAFFMNLSLQYLKEIISNILKIFMHLEDKIKITSDEIVIKKNRSNLCQRKVPRNVSYKLSFKNFQAYGMNAQRNHNAKVSLKGHNM